MQLNTVGMRLDWPSHHLPMTHPDYQERQRQNTLTKRCHAYVRLKWHSLRFILQWVVLTAVILTCLPEQFMQNNAKFGCQILYLHGDERKTATCWTWNIGGEISVQINFAKQNSIWQLDNSVEYDSKIFFRDASILNFSAYTDSRLFRMISADANS